jgi:glycerol-3-phosphate dehydrogenase (NAD(P)+)
MTQHKITILGAGSFGTAIADMLHKNGADVLIWARDVAVVREINERHSNAAYFPNADLAPFPATTDLSAAVTGRDFIVLAIPCQYLSQLLIQIRPHLTAPTVIVNLAKGIEIDTLNLPAQIAAAALGEDILPRYAVISGPTFARELYQRMPSGAVVASRSRDTARTVQRIFSTRHFRLYTGTDVTGVELGGALKNVMAIGVGIADGLGFGLNTRAGLMTRCLHEMIALGETLGANPRTFAGLSGIGDLILTCTGDLSRNRQFGVRVGRGEQPAAVIAAMKHVVEGVTTAKSAHQLIDKLGLDMPNAAHVYRILYDGMSPRAAVESILARELRTEFDEADTPSPEGNL